ncbi:acyltransferase [Naasia sp.]|uniref:acyltransferase family protein n=1 Tax=Naasia sp. TaxID=2546198 RepID=UPI002627B5A8|nr:acyltransferase [Naasia sp.]
MRLFRTGVARAGAAKPSGGRIGRLRSLDGLRGVAAVVVVLHHSLLTAPTLADAYFTPGQNQPVLSPAWLLSYTPLHLFWAGGEAVFLFFVLSGMVLVLPVLQNARFDWFSYYPRRVVRLYGPVAGAVALGLLTFLIVPRFDDRELGDWVIARPDSYDLHRVLKDLVLINGTSGAVSPLWSLKWEVLFSLLLPLYALFAMVGRRFVAVKAAVLLAMLLIGQFYSEAVFYLTMFAIGGLLAAHWRDLAGSLSRFAGAHRWFWPLALVSGLLLTSVRWLAVGFGLPDHVAGKQIWIAVVGVTLLVLCAGMWPPLVRALESRLAQWLGVLSFSLYLVHEPIVLATRFAFARLDVPSPVSMLVAIPIAFGVAVLFSKLVEKPFHAFSRIAGRRAEALLLAALQEDRELALRDARTARHPAGQQPGDQPREFS